MNEDDLEGRLMALERRVWFLEHDSHATLIYPFDPWVPIGPSVTTNPNNIHNPFPITVC